jgi:hypothetical protein
VGASDFIEQIAISNWQLAQLKPASTVIPLPMFRAALRHNPLEMSAEALSCPLQECSALPWYNRPEDHRCPHDSWVQSITVAEPSSGERLQIRRLEIHIRLLGAYHDGVIEFMYRGVQRYSLEGMRDVRGHGDWLKDELKLTKNNRLVHHAILTNGDFEIEAEEIQYKWTPFSSLSVAIPGGNG